MGSLKISKVTLAKYIKRDKAPGSTNISSLVEEEEPIKELKKKDQK